MNHETDDQVFEKYMDGTLDSRAAAEFEEHVKHCPECADRYAGFIKMKKGLSAMEDEPLPDGFGNEWRKKVYSYGRRTGSAARRLRKFMPAIAAGVAVVAVVSAVLLSGVLMPGASLSEAQMAGALPAEENVMAENAAKDVFEESEAAPAPESASAFMAQEAPQASEETRASGEGEASMAVGEDNIAVPLYVSRETFDALTKLMVDEGSDFCLDENLMIVPVTEDNQAAFLEFAQEYALGITPIPGETYEVWVAE